MPGFFEAAEEVWGKEPEKKKIYTVNIQGKEIEVSLEKSLEIMKTQPPASGCVARSD